VTTRPSPELRVLLALDELRDAMAAVLTVRHEPTEPPALLTLTAAAARLGVSRSTASRWADAGALAVVALDGRRWVPYLELGRLAAAAPPPVSKSRHGSVMHHGPVV
jgi:excisionase family DNA binding protein